MTAPDRPPAGPSPDGPPPGPRTLVLSRTSPGDKPGAPHPDSPPRPGPSKAYRLLQVGVGLLGGSALGLAGLTVVGLAVAR